MHQFIVTLTTVSGRITYTIIGNRDQIMDSIYDEHGPCGLVVRPA